MKLNDIDFLVIGIFFVSMIVIGAYAYFKNKSSEDFFVAGGHLPWWLSGISHHVSGYSGAVFVAYAALAYTHGFSLYVWWAFTIGIGVIATAKIFPVYWVRLRKKFKIQSPLEYLAIRYNVVTQQMIAWIGVTLKLFDVGAKWAAIAILLQVTTGISFTAGILISGGVSLIYITVGGLWAVIFTDLAQFLVQLVGGITMFVVVINQLEGWDSIFGIWKELPEGNGQLFNDPYTVGFALVFLFINFLSYNGGSWSLATRYISSDTEREASKAAYLSGILYLIWPLILFFPMWAAPLILPGMENPSESYGYLIQKLLPNGLIGLVIASLFANTMSMTSSDVNTISAVITRDILPVLSHKFNNKRTSLLTARITTFIFTFLTIVVAFQYEYFGGVLGLIITWFGALLGPIAVPLLFGLMPAFRYCGAVAAISSIWAGLIAFSITKIVPMDNLALEVGLPVIVSMIVFSVLGWILKKPVPREVEELEVAMANQPSGRYDK